MKIVIQIAAMIGALAVGAFIYLGFQSRAADAPGMIGGSLAPCGTAPNCVSSLASGDPEHFVNGFEFDAGEADRMWQRLTESIRALDGNLEKNAPPYLAATFSSTVFGFVDDFECLIDKDAGLIHVRAGARAGYSDLGVNRQRVEQIRQLLAAGD
jgi:uncharacterized protein (DUF1499 family)